MDVILAALEALGQPSQAEQDRRAVAPPAPPRPKSQQTPVAAQAMPEPHPAQPAAPQRAAGLLQGLFEDGNSLLRAVIAAEVLQPPLALRQAQEEPAHWNQQPNEPSTSAS